MSKLVRTLWCINRGPNFIDLSDGLVEFLKGRIIPLIGLGWSLFLACSRVFNGDIYGDHDVSCASIVGIKHRHNVVGDTLVDICYCSRILAGKEVDIGLDGGVTNHYIQ
ncbi:hypothetical protein Tco_0352219 [Tanacetum coccineum]